MIDNDEKTGRAVPGRIRASASRWTVIGLVVLWVASLAFLLEVVNLAVVKKFQIDFDPSFEILVAAFCFFATLLGGLLLWRGRRDDTLQPPGPTDRYLNMATVAICTILVLVSISGSIVYSSNQAFLRQETTYVRPAPRPDFNLGNFPTPGSPQPTPTFDPHGKFLSGSLLGSIDHLRVGDIQISASPDNSTIYYVQFNLQPVECLVDQNGTLTTFAVDKSRPLVNGPLHVTQGTFYANQADGVVMGKIISDTEMMGTAYLHYSDPSSGRSCDLGTFEFDVFVLDNSQP